MIVPLGLPCMSQIHLFKHERDSLTSRHKITLHELCCKNQPILAFPLTLSLSLYIYIYIYIDRYEQYNAVTHDSNSDRRQDIIIDQVFFSLVHRVRVAYSTCLR